MFQLEQKNGEREKREKVMEKIREMNVSMIIETYLDVEWVWRKKRGERSRSASCLTIIWNTYRRMKINSSIFLLAAALGLILCVHSLCVMLWLRLFFLNPHLDDSNSELILLERKCCWQCTSLSSLSVRIPANQIFHISFPHISHSLTPPQPLRIAM